MSLPPSAMGARSRDPEPSEPHGLGPRVKICSWSCLSWLHPLRSWSLRQTRGGSETGAIHRYYGCFTCARKEAIRVHRLALERRAGIAIVIADRPIGPV